jgi:hypothetical protein
VNIFWAPVEDPCEPTDFAAVLDFPLAEQVQAEVLMAAAQPYEEELPVLVLMVAGHHAVDARTLVGAGVPGHPAADDPVRYDYTVLFLRHLSSHAYTSHNGPNAVFHPTSASFYGSRNSVYGNTRTAHSIYILAVSQ